MLKNDLLPIGKNRVIDLVRAAGVDVEDWGNYSRGPKFASVNPRYCYEWSFIDPSGVIVLNIWYGNIVERRGRVRVSTNMREMRDDLEARGGKSVWIKRAARMDDTLRIAASSRLGVRVIVNDGDMRDVDNPRARASVVRRRMLDPVPWSVLRYDATSGACVLERGVKQAPLVDQFDMLGRESPTITRVDVNRQAFLRSERVRAAALARAKGRCEFCGHPGFVTAAGEIFLETHHIVPLYAGGKDVVKNVAAVCANHHREAHYGVSAKVIQEHLLNVACGKPAC